MLSEELLENVARRCARAGVTNITVNAVQDPCEPFVGVIYVNWDSGFKACVILGPYEAVRLRGMTDDETQFHLRELVLRAIADGVRTQLTENRVYE